MTLMMMAMQMSMLNMLILMTKRITIRNTTIHVDDAAGGNDADDADEDADDDDDADEHA